MRKALKELVDHVQIKRSGEFHAFMFLPNGKYKGFFGPNGYEYIRFLGLCTDGKWYLIATEIDAIHFFDAGYVNIEISELYGVPCLWANYPFKINYDGLTSSLIIDRRE